jgi:uncharacterized protein (DUF2384 family)
MDPENTEVVVDDRRADIEAAFEAQIAVETPEKVAEKAIETPEKVETAPEKVETVPETEEQVASKPTDEKSVEGSTAETDVAVLEKAPQAWKASTKAKWDTLDPEIRQEVLRREHQISGTLNETAQVRQFATQFQQVVQPYLPRLQELKVNPITMVGELLRIDKIMAEGTAVQKAQQVAAIIKDSAVDIDTLAEVLSGRTPDATVSAQVEQLLQQRLLPFQQFMTQQEQARQAQEQAEQAALVARVAAMATDPKFPHFEKVRETMADLLQIDATKINPGLTIESAYNKAVKMMDLDAGTLARNAAAEADAKAQRALKASKSITGAPRAAMAGSPASTDRRAIIEAAFDQLSSR